MTTEIIPTLHPIFAERVSFRNNSVHGDLWTILDGVCDPELPGLTLWDLGVLQDVQQSNGVISVVITPTYSGCPAVDAMSEDAIKALNDSGFDQVEVKVVLAPAWSTDMISPAGKQQLKALHIAPPNDDNSISCPVCDSGDTQVLSEFGSTACKAMYRCNHCMEVFDYFKKL
ncbi:MAG: phenylacetate-CoA oxygenase subunit PaaJ [Colwellia sp.]|nr:phenylacetate-CoA oxygenase subunit PaaJ [Colwellia sp.]